MTKNLLGLLAVVLLLAMAWPLQAQAPAAALQNAPVKIGNRVVIQLRGPIAGYTAQERASGATERIGKILEQQARPLVTFEPAEEGAATRVLLGGSHAFLVTPIDIDKQAGESTQNVAREAAARIERAIVELRDTQTPQYLGRAALVAFLLTIAYAVLLRLTFAFTRWSGRRLSRLAEARAQGLQVAGVQQSHVLLYTRRFTSTVNWTIGIALTIVWLTAVLELFPFTRPWGEELAGHLLGIVGQVALAIVGAIPGLVFVVLILLLARLANNAGSAFFDRVESGALELGWMDRDAAKPTSRIFRVVVWVFALAMAYPYLPGAQTEAFKGLSVMVGLMVSLGAASVVGQAFNGLILMYSRTFRAGDYVRIGDNEGTVAEVGMFVTRVRTGLGEEVTLPNSGIMAGNIVNYSRAVVGTGYVVDTTVTIGYATPWRQVEAMLVEAARRVPAISRTPEPVVRQTALSDFYPQYRLIAYTPAENPKLRAEVLSDLHANIQDVFNEHGVQIMSPHYLADPPAPQVVAKKDWYAAPARPPA